VTDLARWGGSGFPHKEPLWNDAGSRLALVARRHGSLIALGAAALSLAVSGVLALGYLRYERLATAQELAVRRAQSANADLQDALARLRDQLGAANQTLTTTQSRIAALSDAAHRASVSEEAASSKADRVALLTRTLEQAQRELHLAEAQRVTLMARLSKSESDAADRRARQQQVEAGIQQWQKKVEQLTGERDQLRARLGKLEQKLSSQPAQAPRPLAMAAPPTAAPAATARQVAAPPATAAVAPAAAPATAAIAPAPAHATAPVAVATVDRGAFAQVERVLASTGVDVRHLFAQLGVSGGLGGPMVPVPPGGVPTLSAEKLAALSRLVNVLPVSAPLATYRVGSPFGVRGDPMNGDREFHTGLDLLAPYESPVYATAPGVVTFAGYRDDYGKIVEIDHGHGIATRYAHLHRFVVSVGEHVAARQQIGFLGSTGRATGPHVHYEVLVNGEPQDPEKFLGLARLIRVAQH